MEFTVSGENVVRVTASIWEEIELDVSPFAPQNCLARARF